VFATLVNSRMSAHPVTPAVKAYLSSSPSVWALAEVSG
jgi:hypothetical protein